MNTKNKRLTNKELKEFITAELEKTHSKTISNCNFEGVHWDAKAVDSVTTIAEGLKQNAISLGQTAIGLQKLAEVLKASNVTIDAMMKIEN